ncbi:GDSL-type esterase/lipase family protein [Psychrobacter vallis]|uniref:GDSL-type esterase/lipase family protein n=1 Tax=Psychrobacter vallis TaxID=248451 RepID=UPI0019194E99|nr:GDSL-type esterase/lipase family protein [Psychrobacter vallis]
MKFGERFLALASVGLAATISMTGCSSEPQQAVLPEDSIVVALGDSLTYGYGTSLETAYPMVLAELSKWRVINAGVNGDTSADVLARVDEIVKKAPDLVLLGVGGNDVLQRLPPDTTRANITATIDTLKSANIDVVLIAEPYFSTSALFGKASDNPLYKDIASAQDVPLYSGGWSAVLSDDTLKSDRIHANQAGYRQFAEGLYEYLQDEGVAQ